MLCLLDWPRSMGRYVKSSSAFWFVVVDGCRSQIGCGNSSHAFQLPCWRATKDAGIKKTYLTSPWCITLLENHIRRKLDPALLRMWVDALHQVLLARANTLFILCGAKLDANMAWLLCRSP